MRKDPYQLCKFDQLDSPATAIDNPYVIDVETGTAQLVETVEIENGIITHIGARNREDVKRIDGSNRYLIPGLWDMHTHVISNAPLAFPMYLANGVTGLRDMGSDITSVLTWRDYPKPMPRLIYTGPIIDGFNSIPLTRLYANKPEEVDIQISTVLYYGADIVKIHNNLPRDVFYALAKRCKEENVTFSGHIPICVDPFEAVEAGQKTIEHMIGIHKAVSSKGQMLREQMMDENTTGWDTLLFDYEAFEAFDQERFDRYVDLLKKHDVYVPPTLSGFERCSGKFDMENPWVACYPAQSREEMRQYNQRFETDDVLRVLSEKIELLYDVNKKLAKLLYDAGVPLLAGTDTLWVPYHYEVGILYGDSLKRELELLCEIGISPAEVLRIATLNAAKYLELDDKIGTVSEGKVADLVLLNKNPLEKIENTRCIQGVFLGGQYYDDTDLKEMQMPN